MIRDAVPDDAPELVEMGRAFFAEAGWADKAEFCPESFALTLERLSEAGILLVFEKDGKPVGMAGALYSPAYWNEKVLIGQELFWYCEPPHRKGAGAELLRHLESAAKARNVQFFGMVAEHGLRHEALAQVYKRAGYSVAEHTFCKAL
jgi:GNAT superfamily N-acetyltransferase